MLSAIGVLKSLLAAFITRWVFSLSLLARRARVEGFQPLKIKHGPGSTNIGVAAFVAAAQKPSQEEGLPTRSALYLALLGASKCLVRQRVVASAASVSLPQRRSPFCPRAEMGWMQKRHRTSQAASPTVAKSFSNSIKRS